jgi:hypothetical protein
MDNPQLRITVILTVAVELLQLISIALQLTVLTIESAAAILCAPIYLLIYFTESLIGNICSQPLTKPIQTSTDDLSKRPPANVDHANKLFYL